MSASISHRILRGQKFASHLLLRSQRRRISDDASGIQNVGIQGLGLMGHGICQVAAAAAAHSPNQSVVAYEPEQKFLDSGKDRIAASLGKLVSKGKINQEEADKTMGSIHFTTDLSDLRDMDLIVEAVIEKMDLKQEIYTNLGQICDEKTIFASNTSGLSITEMAAFSGRPDRFLGVHFFNPVQLMKLVEGKEMPSFWVTFLYQGYISDYISKL
jgi:3-hydroxyacyl-CoA dehydrogenase